MATNHRNAPSAPIRQQRDARPVSNGRGSHYAPSGGPKKSKNKYARILSLIMLILGIVLLVVAAIFFGKEMMSKNNAHEAEVASQELLINKKPVEEKPAAPATDPNMPKIDIPKVDWAAAQKLNKDIVAWVQIPGTVINYPVVQAANNEYYLNRTIKGNEAVAGSIFMDSDCSRTIDGKHTILYGHNMRNGSMFHAIDSFTQQKFFDAHRTVYLLTPQKNYVLKALAMYRTDGGDANVRVFDFKTDADFTNYLKSRIKNSAIVAKDINLDQVKQLFEFSTCSYDRTDGRAILMAVPDESVRPVESAGSPINNSEGKLVPLNKTN